MEMTMRLPSNYVEIEEEEMMYLDGGWSWTHVKGNIQGLLNRHARSLGFQARMAGISTATIKSAAMTAFKTYFPKISSTIVSVTSKITGLLGGWVGWLVGIIAGCGVIYALANWRIFY